MVLTNLRGDNSLATCSNSCFHDNHLFGGQYKIPFVNACLLLSPLSLQSEFATVPAPTVLARLFVHLVESMLKRLLSAFSPDTTANKLLRLDWIEALQTPGCALCHMAQRKSQRYVETLLNEAVTDVDQRDTWRAARGLCHWHAWMATETPHSGGSLAILYADVLHRDLEHLAVLTAAVPATRRWRSQRSLAQRLQGWLRSWRQQRPCPVCCLWREQERLYLHVLLDDWQEPGLAQAFAASSGLCWRHTLHLVEQGRQHAHVQAVLTAQQVHLQRLQDELHEFIRKLDYRLARQPYGREADAWRRVIALYAGGTGWAGQRGAG
jgi:hypothetical protein